MIKIINALMFFMIELLVFKYKSLILSLYDSKDFL